MNLKTISDYLISRLPKTPKTAVILGSGLGSFVNSMKDRVVIPFADIPDYPQSTILGHAGEWVFGYIKGKPIICASGRFHIYEGFSMEEVTLPILVIQEVGCKQLIITNSSGSLKKNWNIGDFMLIRGYMDYTFSLNKGNPKIVNIETGVKRLNQIHSTASELGIQLWEGIYTWTLGPSYETPAEIDDIISMGGNAVGMSTVPEIMKAMELDLNIIGISCLTNYGAGMESKKLSHSSVLKTSNLANAEFSRLISEIL